MINVDDYYLSNFIKTVKPLPVKALPDYAAKAIGVLSDASDFYTPPEIAGDVFQETEAILVEIPLKDIIKAIEASQWFKEEGYADFWRYHDNYKCSDVPNYGATDRWPVILANKKLDEVLLDGWHRFHSYVAAGHDTIPVMVFDDPMPEFEKNSHLVDDFENRLR